jgi:1-deoxyxylulose-5-phosphate synthase
MPHSSRRDFIKAGVAASTLSALPLAGAPKKRLATDWVTLGKSNVKVTRLAFGTGTFSGAVQRELGQQEFTRLVRHAYDGHSILRNGGKLSRNGRDAGYRTQRPAARQL